jgi:hypothetical protein
MIPASQLAYLRDKWGDDKIKEIEPGADDELKFIWLLRGPGVRVLS